MSCHCSPEIKHNYFVVMIDYQNGRGREAVVDPEVTRREVVSRILSGEYDRDRISFIHHVDDGHVDDITSEVLAECSHEALAHHVSALEAGWDHARALRNEVA